MSGNKTRAKGQKEREEKREMSWEEREAARAKERAEKAERIHGLAGKLDELLQGVPWDEAALAAASSLNRLSLPWGARVELTTREAIPRV